MFEVLCLEYVVVDVFGWDFGCVVWFVGGLCYDKVVEFDDF